MFSVERGVAATYQAIFIVLGVRVYERPSVGGMIASRCDVVARLGIDVAFFGGRQNGFSSLQPLGKVGLTPLDVRFSSRQRCLSVLLALAHADQHAPY